MDCLSEFPEHTITYYFDNIKRINPEIFYIDYTNLSNGNIVTKLLGSLNKEYKLIIDRLTPITCYMCPYISPTYGSNDIMKEVFYKK